MALPATPPISRTRSASRPLSQASDSPQSYRRGLEVESIPHCPSFENLNYYARHDHSHSSLDTDDDDHSTHDTDSIADTAEKRREHFSNRQSTSKSSTEERRRDYGDHYYKSEVLSGSHHEDQPFRRASEGIGGRRERIQRMQLSASGHFHRADGERVGLLMRRDKTTGM